MIHEFKVIAREESNVIKGASWNKALGKVITLFKNEGAAVDRAAQPNERINIYDVSLPSKEPVPGKENQTRYYGTYKFFDKETESKLKAAEQSVNRQTRAWYEFLQIHDHVIVKGPDGNNTNMNDIHSMFELIDITGNTQKMVELNNKKFEAGILLKNLYEESPEAFLDFCYAYGVPDVANLDPATLYNMCVMKMVNNPHYMINIYNNKNRSLLTLIEKALTINIGSEQEVRYALEIRESKVVYMDGEPIAQNRDELVEVLLLDVAKRRVLEGLVAYTVTSAMVPEKVEVEVPKEIDNSDINIVKEATANGRKESKLQLDFTFKVRPIITHTKDTATRDEKVKSLIDDPKFVSIKQWATEYAAEKIAAKLAKEKPAMVLKSEQVD
jgi:hypothetical protein